MILYASSLSCSVTEDIILGPPKTPFSSASGTRSGHKNLDVGNSAKSTSTDYESTNGNHIPFKEKLGKDGNRIERDANRHKDSRIGLAHNRRGILEPRNSQSFTQELTFSGYDAEKGSRRNGDRDSDREKDGVREPRVRRGFENYRRDGDREASEEGLTRRNVPRRDRLEPAWYQDEDGQIGAQLESDQDTTTPRVWRTKEKNGVRVRDREWNSGGKLEQDPEWMDEPESEDRKQTHTQEDFERWKERMKASNGSAQDRAFSPAAAERPSHERADSNISVSVSKAKLDTPLAVDPNLGGFFGLWNREVGTLSGEQKGEATVNKANIAKPSKFTGFFNSKPATDLEPPTSPLPSETANDCSSEDKEGFQRILKLLDQQQPNVAKNGTPNQVNQLRSAPQSPPTQPPRSREPNGLESLLGPHIPNHRPVSQNKDSEFLLKLMQQTQQPRQHIQHNKIPVDQGQGVDSTPGLLPFSNLVISPRDTNPLAQATSFASGYFHEAFKDEQQHHDKLNPHIALDQKALISGSYDRPTMNNLSTSSAVPIGLQRPPGLEQMSSGYGINFQHQRRGMIPAPPGFQGLPRTNNPYPPGLNPNTSSTGNVNDIGPPTGSRRAVGSGGRGVPPSALMGLNAFPPGFSPPPYGHDGRISPTGLWSHQMRLSRQGNDGFSDGVTFAMGGQGMPPGQYCRPD